MCDPYTQIRKKEDEKEGRKEREKGRKEQKKERLNLICLIENQQ